MAQVLSFTTNGTNNGWLAGVNRMLGTRDNSLPPGRIDTANVFLNGRS